MASVIPKLRTGRGGLSVPLLGRREKSIPIVSQYPDTPFSESFRLLALNVLALTKNKSRKSIAVMSAFPRDGRTTVAVNLAVSLAEHAQVVLYDCDEVSARSTGSAVALEAATGYGADHVSRLRALDTSQEDEAEASAKQDNGLWFADPVTASRSGRDNLEGIEHLSNLGVYSVFDLPPASASANAFTLAQKAGTAIYVIRQRPQDMNVHLGVREHLARLGVDLIGLVVNEY